MLPFCKAEYRAVSLMFSVSGRRISLWNKYWQNIYHQILEFKAEKVHLTEGPPICSLFTASSPDAVWIWLLWEKNIPQQSSEAVPHHREKCIQEPFLLLIRETLCVLSQLAPWGLITQLRKAEGLASADEAWSPLTTISLLSSGNFNPDSKAAVWLA